MATEHAYWIQRLGDDRVYITYPDNYPNVYGHTDTVGNNTYRYSDGPGGDANVHPATATDAGGDVHPGSDLGDGELHARVQDACIDGGAATDGDTATDVPER